MTDLIGKTLGQYQILREIGRGGMAVVYEAHQPSLGRSVAIKVLPSEFTFDQTFVKRFLQEARAAARLTHPYIVPIYDVGQQNGVYYIVMQKLEGASLHSLIERTGRLPLPRVAHILAQVAAALDFAHAGGLVHRDIKPANIFIGPGDHATVMDFGIAKALAGTQLTQSGVMMGTPAYMSPEQATGKPVGPASDVYSLGLVVYQMLAGRVPFQADSTPALLYKQVHETPPPLRVFAPETPPAVEAVVARSLAKDPAQRFRSAGEMARALQGTMTGRAVQAARPATKSNVLLWGGIGAGLLALFLLLAVFTRDTPSPSVAGSVPGIVDTPGAAASPMPAPPTPTPPPPTPTPAPQQVTSVASATQQATATPTTAPTRTPTPAPEPVGRATVEQLNLREGPGSTFPVIRRLASGEQVELLGRNQVGDWLWVSTAGGQTGWVSSQYVEHTLPISQLAVLPTPVPPSCRVAVDPALAPAYDQSRLGCAQMASLVSWAAWEPFERGSMLWLKYNDALYLTYDNGAWQELPDRWDEQSVPPSRGQSPPGLRAPVRGFGWLWGTNDDVFRRLGWAREDEKGICVSVQFFERGLIYRTVRANCGDYNHATDPGFGQLFYSFYGDETWRRF